MEKKLVMMDVQDNRKDTAKSSVWISRIKYIFKQNMIVHRMKDYEQTNFFSREILNSRKNSGIMYSFL